MHYLLLIIELRILSFFYKILKQKAAVTPLPLFVFLYFVFCILFSLFSFFNFFVL